MIISVTKQRQTTDIIVKDLDTAAKMPNSPFTRCQPYFSYFKKYGDMYNGAFCAHPHFGCFVYLKRYLVCAVPPIVMASFANQESGCDPQNHGGAGEIGMMQITPDKCGGAPNGDCYNLVRIPLVLYLLKSDLIQMYCSVGL